MTFTVATTREPCSFPTIVTLSGPALTYGLAYAGLFLLRSPRYALFAYALIFASFAHVRFIQVLSGRGDELVLAQQWFSATSPLAVAVIVFLMGLPPVVAAFRVIGNKFETTDMGTRLGSVLGIWSLVLIVDLLAAALFVAAAPRYLCPQFES